LIYPFERSIPKLALYVDGKQEEDDDHVDEVKGD